MPTIAQALTLALQHHQAGRLAEAEALYRQILAAQPEHAEAWHHLGVIAQQAGRPELAVEWIRRAIAIQPDNAAAHSNLGDALGGTGQFAEAIAAYRQAIQLDPGMAAAHNNLGIALVRQRRWPEAVDAFHRAQEIDPQFAESYNNLGLALAVEGELDAAAAAYRRALELKPAFAEACNNLGITLGRQNRFEEALAAYRRAIELNPSLAAAHNNLGMALAGQKKWEEALAAYRRALALDPAYAEAHNNLGAGLAEQGRWEEAMTAHCRALELRPTYPEAYYNMGHLLMACGQAGEAASAYRRALELLPTYAEASNNLGLALASQGHFDEAVAAIQQALQLRPDCAEFHINLGNAFKEQGRLDEAIAAYRRATELSPHRAWMHSNLSYTLLFHPAQDTGAMAEELQKWNRQFGEPFREFVRPHDNHRDPERRLRIGYISGDFRNHVIGWNLLPLLERHDHGEFEILCYSGVRRPDHLTAALHQHANQWRETAGLADEALAEMIREDGVDILVDLSQHLGGNCLTIFARQPAPVQISFAGYPEATGLETIGYRISDRYLESHQPATHEQVLLIDSFWCYDPCGIAMEVNDLPAPENGHVTFGSLNAFCKINEPVLKLWARVLRKVQNSRLLLLSHEGSHTRQAREIFQREGIAPERVEFVESRPRPDYLALYHRIDIVLDPFPYGGHTTGLDALWMGVPVVSLAGRDPVSRAGSSQLTNLGQHGWIAFCEDDYVQTAARLAGDLPGLTELRRTLRSQMQASPLMDAPRFARQIEAAYRAAWRQWCGQPST